jgi:hypothetical protein
MWPSYPVRLWWKKKYQILSFTHKTIEQTTERRHLARGVAHVNIDHLPHKLQVFQISVVTVKGTHSIVLCWWELLLTMRSRVRFPVLPCEFSLAGEDPHSDHGLGSLQNLGLRPLLIIHAQIIYIYIYIYHHTHHGRPNLRIPLHVGHKQDEGVSIHVWRHGGWGIIQGTFMENYYRKLINYVNSSGTNTAAIWWCWDFCGLLHNIYIYIYMTIKQSTRYAHFQWNYWGLCKVDDEIYFVE